MMSRVATGTIVSTSICYRMISSIYVGVVTTWLGTWLVITGHPVDVAISMATVSSILKELAGVSGRVWSEAVHSMNMIF